MAYFRRRHLTPEHIAYFKLGFAPPEWDRLFRDFTQKNRSDRRFCEAQASWDTAMDDILICFEIDACFPS